MRYSEGGLIRSESSGCDFILKRQTLRLLTAKVIETLSHVAQTWQSCRSSINWTALGKVYLSLQSLRQIVLLRNTSPLASVLCWGVMYFLMTNRLSMFVPCATPSMHLYVVCKLLRQDHLIYDEWHSLQVAKEQWQSLWRPKRPLSEVENLGTIAEACSRDAAPTSAELYAE